jgi:hypothetical protein
MKILTDEMAAAVAYAAERGIKLVPDDFEYIEGRLSIDGIDAIEWIDEDMTVEAG